MQNRLAQGAPVHLAQSVQSNALAPKPEPRFRPLQQGEFRNNGDGSYSTELLMAEILDPASGESMVFPSMWMSDRGPVELSVDEAIGAAMEFERMTGNRFPRFKSIREAIDFSKTRSSGGGVSAGPLYRR